MAKRKNAARQAVPAAGAVTSAAISAASAPSSPSGGASGAAPSQAGGAAAAVLCALVFLAPAVGMPTEEVLQDTLKSALVSVLALVAAGLLCWRQRGPATAATAPLRWHGVLWLPLLLAAFALASMAWSHRYLAGVETIRWCVFALIAWAALNSLDRAWLPRLALAVHLGAVVAALWGALQFWFDFEGIPQGPNPASTFVNRNFFAEYLVCALPFSAVVLARARTDRGIALAALGLGLNIVALMSTGTRSALIAGLVLAVLLPIGAVRYRAQLGWHRWPRAHRWLAAALVAVTVLGLGSLPTGNARLMDDARAQAIGLTPITRSAARLFAAVRQEEYTEKSFSIRLVMWKATARMIAAHPLLGVGAGAWEVMLPIYQAEGSQVETDYYVHNEYLQLAAEYGFVGWLFLSSLLSFLGASALATWRGGKAETTEGGGERIEEAPWRATALASLLALLLVSGAGFPWHLAATGALFALNLGVLLGSDARLGRSGFPFAQSLRWTPLRARLGAAVAAGGLALALFVSWQAFLCESLLVRAVKIAMSISLEGGDLRDPKFDAAKAEMLGFAREGIAINPHYRKLTPMVSDEIAKWGDWKNAIWMWESMVASRPYVVAMLANLSRGYMHLDQYDKARSYLERAQAVQPKAPAVWSLQMSYLDGTGHGEQAQQVARRALDLGIEDDDLLRVAYGVALKQQDWALALRVLRLHMTMAPDDAARTWIKIGRVQAEGLHDDAQALEAFRAALAATPEPNREAMRREIPIPYQHRLP